MVDALKSQVAVVVGASSGMGRAIATDLSRAGARVVAAARREHQLRRLQEDLQQAGHDLRTAVVDTTQETDIDRLIADTVRAFGAIDLLVYATGTNRPDRSLETMTAETWDTMLATNLSGAFHCTRAVLPTMRGSGGGLIIYLSSAAVQMPDVSGVAYQASKHGLTGLAHGTRVEERHNGIRTTVIFPGLCDTEILKQRPTPTPAHVLQHALDPQDVSDAVLFVASLPARAVVPELQLLPSRL
ncbi:MAG: SDR family oxidoreductase [Planctomycetaceae bacterium]